MSKFLLPLVLVVLLPLSQAFARTWTDAQGKTAMGNYVRVFNGDVVIERPNKSILKVPYWNLSEADRDYVKGELEKKGQTNLIPPEPAKNIGGNTGAPGAAPVIPGIPAPFPSGVPVPTAPAFTPPVIPGDPGAAPPTVPLPGFPPGFGPGNNTQPPAPSIPPLPGFTPPEIPQFTPPEIPRYTPPPMPEFTPPTTPSYTPPKLEYVLKCRKCGYTFNSDSMISTAPCPSCGSTGGDPFSGSSSTDSSARAARQAGAITGVILMIACPLVIGLVMLVVVIAIIFFVVKAVSAPAPAQARRKY